jgi:hypothetical protein
MNVSDCTKAVVPKKSSLDGGTASTETLQAHYASGEKPCEATPRGVAQALPEHPTLIGKESALVNPDTDKRTGGLFEPDVVLPTQFFGTLRRQAPTKRGECQLLVAVLEDAVHCFQKYLLANDRQGQRLFREAQQWMMTEGAPTEDGPMLSFGYVCEMLGLDPSYLREGLHRWCERQLAQPQGARRVRDGECRAA